MLLSLNRREARYATVGTPRKFWQTWREEDADGRLASLAAREPNAAERAALAGALEDDTPTAERPSVRLQGLIDRPLAVAEARAVYAGAFAGARSHFEALVAEGERAITPQDRALFALCRPERLLDLVRRFTVFDGGVRKIARHQQFFGIRSAVERVKQYDTNGCRKGGVIWHTQGSGKSLTMVMLGRALALDKDIANPRIVIVTDRDDLDRQIKDTFRSCELEPVRATSGAHLLKLIRNKTALVTTIINKFDTASRSDAAVDLDTNIFVLVGREPPQPDRPVWRTRRVRHEDATHPAERLLSRFHRHAATAKGEEYPVHLWVGLSTPTR